MSSIAFDANLFSKLQTEMLKLSQVSVSSSFSASPRSVGGCIAFRSAHCGPPPATSADSAMCDDCSLWMLRPFSSLCFQMLPFTPPGPAPPRGVQPIVQTGLVFCAASIADPSLGPESSYGFQHYFLE